MQVRQHHRSCHRDPSPASHTFDSSAILCSDNNTVDGFLSTELDSHSFLSPSAAFGQRQNLTFTNSEEVDGHAIASDPILEEFFDSAFDDSLDLEEDFPSFGQPVSTEEKFMHHIVSGDARVAASILVKQAAYQTPDPPEGLLPISSIMLFLYLARLVMSSGPTQHHYLSKLLQILYPSAAGTEPNWAPLPCTISGFSSQILNKTNSNSLVSILPIPVPETMSDGHGYTPLRNILSHALMMHKFDEADSKDTKWTSLASSKKFKAFLSGIQLRGLTPMALRQLAIGLLLWTDGWDPSTGCKSNRSPICTLVL